MLHPQARALLDLIEQRAVPPTHTLSVEDARRFYRERRFFTQPDTPEVAHVEDMRTDDGIPLRLYKPLGAEAGLQPALVYYHGGGWTIGDLDTHDTLCRQLANRSGCVLLSVDYRLGPEHRFPAAVDDSIAALRWVHTNASALGIDAARIAIGGDSAGGNLAAVATIDARDNGGPPLAFQLLIYPATDMRAIAASHVTNGQGYLLTSNTVRYFHDHYIDDRKHDLDWRASPLLHPDLSRLPPAFILTAGFDPLRDEGLMYAQRLSEAGTRTTSICFDRQIHGFITMGRVLDEANAAVDICASQLKAALIG
ncbi:alpha/beta hydrolase [Noviherbaspirillum sp. ST9]|uniref:alpha/beta hydrolase n=1 Tax=Noviherbaspirillum sp. ST9 TaxID=3401606 RepID=UPI003B58945C